MTWFVQCLYFTLQFLGSLYFIVNHKKYFKQGLILFIREGGPGLINFMLRCCLFTSTGAVLISHVENTPRSSHFMIRAAVLGFTGLVQLFAMCIYLNWTLLHCDYRLELSVSSRPIMFYALKMWWNSPYFSTPCPIPPSLDKTCNSSATLILELVVILSHRNWNWFF